MNCQTGRDRPACFQLIEALKWFLVGQVQTGRDFASAPLVGKESFSPGNILPCLAEGSKFITRVFVFPSR